MAAKKTSATEETVTVELPKDRTHKENPLGVYVAVNGKAMFVPRGKKVDIPKPYAEALRLAAVEQDKADDFITEELEKAQNDMNA